MKRSMYNRLKHWKASVSRKPLVLQGARQVGKTYLVEKFGRKEYRDYVYINFEQNPEYASLFERSLDPGRIVEELSFIHGHAIKPEHTLLFFDEIQAAPRVLTSLKYFCEQTPEHHVIAAGSLLGVAVGKSNSFPVGKVDMMTMYPMTFMEFLLACHENRIAEMLLVKNDAESLSEPVHNKLQDLLKRYLFTGGMPEVVSAYIDRRDVAEVRDLQHKLLDAYMSDFSKYSSSSQAIKTSEIWRSIPKQLARENKKFKYSEAKKKKGSAYFHASIEWLRKAGLCHIVSNIENPKLPLSMYADPSKFKLYLHDTGLLGAMLNVSSELIASPDDLFKEANGAFVENYVATQLIASGVRDVFYWTSGNTAEVDFILQLNDNVTPLEVKSGTSLRMKSLQVYKKRYNPRLCVRISPLNYRFHPQAVFLNVPLYAADLVESFVPAFVRTIDTAP